MIARTILPAMLAAALGTFNAHASEEETQVFVISGELNYVGKLSSEANAKLFALYEGMQKKPTTLAIRSPGGNTDLGMALGAWVHRNKLDVKVLESCYSSCANYVFTAARNKIVSNFAAVGYHGGLSSTQFALDEGTEAQLAALPADQRAKARAEIMASFRQFAASQQDREEKYFASIGVQQRITTLGQAEKYTKAAPASSVGWYYSIEDFAKLGVSNITVINPPWQPKLLTSSSTLFQVTVAPD